MSINIGDINIANEIVDLHYQLHRTQKLLEIILAKTSVVAWQLTPSDIALAEDDAVKYVQHKFPNMGIEKKTQKVEG